MSINKYLWISTAHVTITDDNLLADEIEATKSGIRLPEIICWDLEPGTLISVSPEHPIEEITGAGFSSAFTKVYQYARDNGCYLIRLCPDGDIMDEFEQFEW